MHISVETNIFHPVPPLYHIGKLLDRETKANNAFQFMLKHAKHKCHQLLDAIYQRVLKQLKCEMVALLTEMQLVVKTDFPTASLENGQCNTICKKGIQ